MAASPKYRVEYDARKGRLAVATCAIKAGTQLLTTPAYAAVSLSACNWCFVASASLKRCGGCQHVRYCSRQCQQQDWTSGAHGSECAAWKTIPLGCASQTVLLVARMASTLFLGKEQQPRDLELLALRHHYDDHTAVKLKEFEEMAQLVLLMLVRSKLNTERFTFEELQTKYEREIVLLFCRINCNAFTICDDVNVPTGVGMFPEAAMLNHSCAPNCVVSFSSPQTLKIQVIRPVQEGEELTISYVELLESTGKRQRALQASYFFACECSRCLEAATNRLDDWVLDGYVCGNESCHGITSVVVVEDGEAICQACGATADAAEISHWLEELYQEDHAREGVSPSVTWQTKQREWEIVAQRIKCHPRSTLYASTSRSMANFLIDNGHYLSIDSTTLAMAFLERERLATEWILPDWPLPTRGLLYFQLAKMYAQLHRFEDAKSSIRHALTILSCAYGSDHRLVHAAQDLLRDL